MPKKIQVSTELINPEPVSGRDQLRCGKSPSALSQSIFCSARSNSSTSERSLTTVERTVVDVLHRPDLAGGVEEVLKSLDLVRYVDPAKIADYVELLDNRSIASVSGWWLEKRRAALSVTDDVLARLRARLPRSKHYALGAESGHAVLVEPWRALLPAAGRRRRV